jgi:predicted TPR repeat methyltransferase
MPSTDDDLRAAMAAHKAERFDEAEAGYLRVLQARPTDPKALYYLGLLQFHRGDTASAIALIQRCLGVARSNGPAWITLGGLFIAAGRNTEARDAYQRATAVAPAMGEGWYNLGICLRDEGNLEGAADALRASIVHEPAYFRSYDALAMLLYQLGRTQEAAGIYSAWVAREPDNPKARHMAAATSQENVPARAADDYVRDLFDSSAKSFDADLAKLNYRAPELVAFALAREAVERRRSSDPTGAKPSSKALGPVLDAGCGTGLCGPLVRPNCEHLTGVDLSPQMIERATARQCYDELVTAELSEFMRTRADGFDAIVCADALVYFGALEEPLNAARNALRPRGLLVFTLESLGAGSVEDFHLEDHGRYAHGEPYIRGALAASGFDVVSYSHACLREERGHPVDGVIVAARRV